MAPVRQASLAFLRLHIPPVHLGVSVSQPRLHLEQELPAVQIDIRRPMEELLGLERHLTLARRAAQQGRDAVSRYTAEKSREGDLLREFQWGIDVVDIATEQGKPPHKELNVDVAPKSRVKIQVKPGAMQVDLEPGQVRVEVPFRLVDVDLYPPFPPFPGKSREEKRGVMLDTYG